MLSPQSYCFALSFQPVIQWRVDKLLPVQRHLLAIGLVLRLLFKAECTQGEIIIMFLGPNFRIHSQGKPKESLEKKQIARNRKMLIQLPTQHPSPHAGSGISDVWVSKQQQSAIVCILSNMRVSGSWLWLTSLCTCYPVQS